MISEGVSTHNRHHNAFRDRHRHLLYNFDRIPLAARIAHIADGYIHCTIRLHIHESIENVRQTRGRKVLRVVIPLVDAPVMGNVAISPAVVPLAPLFSPKHDAQDCTTYQLTK